MRILIACEESQIVTEQFILKGHDVMSCDIEYEGARGLPHYKGDVLDILNDGWDMMIAFPPCTYLANCGLHYLKTKPERKEQHLSAVNFFMNLYNAPINKIALENPIGWMNTNWQKPNQIIQPYYFGERELKSTCLWLKNLPLLKYKIEDDLFGKKTATDKPKPIKFVIRKSGKNTGQKYNYYFRQGKKPRERSKTFLGVAKAMADQWG